MTNGSSRREAREPYASVMEDNRPANGSRFSNSLSRPRGIYSRRPLLDVHFQVLMDVSSAARANASAPLLFREIPPDSSRMRDRDPRFARRAHSYPANSITSLKSGCLKRDCDQSRGDKCGASGGNINRIVHDANIRLSVCDA